MVWINIKRIIRSGFYSFFRNGLVSLSSILVMVITLSVICSIIFFSAILDATLEEVRNKVDVNVYFVTTASEDDILAIKKKVESLQEVAVAVYISREKALEDFKKRHENDQFTLQALDELGENPLGATLNIKAKEPSQYEGIAEFLKGKNILSNDGAVLVDKVNYFQNKVAIDKLSKIIDSADRLGFIFTIVLVMISILITFNTIRLVIYMSKDEISVMRLVGASTFYIRGPFIFTGILYGIIAGLITLILFYPITYWLGGATKNFFIGINIFTYYFSHFGQIFAVVMLSGILISAVSSYLAVRKYLKI